MNIRPWCQFASATAQEIFVKGRHVASGSIRSNILSLAGRVLLTAGPALSWIGSIEGSTTNISLVTSRVRKIGEADLVGDVRWLPELSADKRLGSN